MEGAVRHLRTPQAPELGKVQFLLVQDSLQVLGGRTACCKVVTKLCHHVAQTPSPVPRVVVLAFESNPQLYHPTHQAVLAFVDCFSDPYGWRTPPERPAQAVAWRSGKGLEALRQAVDDCFASQEGGAFHVVIDSVDHLLQHTALAEVVRHLQILCSHPATLSVCAKLHEDLHSPQVLAAVTSLCTASLHLLPLHGLRKDLAAHAHPSKQAVHGELQLHLKRHTGRVKVETDLYTLLQSNDMEIHESPSEAITAQLLAARAVSSGAENTRQSAEVDVVRVEQPAVHEALLTSQAGMKLKLTDQEREARQAVILPYEHQGSGQVYQTGDFRDYLPHAAGGQGKGTNGTVSLGHIMYVRDSESEHDSDEDPDDDLDI